MPVVRPFRAIRYNPAKFSDLTPLLTPPYDVISEREQGAFYDRHPHNMIRLDFGKTEATDSAVENRYIRAARQFAEWQTQHVLIQDDTPALYPASVQYTTPIGESKTLQGFFGLVQLEEFGTGRILPHEWTFSAAKQDRMNLLRACQAHFSSIFFVTSNPGGELRTLLRRAMAASAPMGQAEERRPPPDGAPDHGARHTLWKLTEPRLLTELTSVVADTPLLIADGHHRYETALAFQRASPVAGAPNNAPSPSGYCLGFITDSHDPGLSILATHRVVRQLPNFNGAALVNRLKERFLVTPLSAPTRDDAVTQLLADLQQRGQSQPTIGLMGRGIDVPMLLTYSEPASAQLDVSILQSEILEQQMGITEESAVGAGQLQYVKDPYDAARRLSSGDAQAVFFLNPTPIEAIEAIARSGGRMPRKTTYFLPKPLTGGVIYRLDPSTLSD